MSTATSQYPFKLYRNLEVLQTGRRDQLLLPLNCYPHLDGVSAVAIAHFEAWHLALTCPILWRDAGASGPELCALVTKPIFSAVRTKDMRPRLVAAYPFAPAWLRGSDSDQLTVMYDRAPDPLPADARGQPVLDATGNFTSAAQERVEALFLYAAGIEATRTLTQELVAQSLLQPWEVALRFGEYSRPLVGAFRLSDDWFDRLDRSRFDDGTLPRLMEVLQAHLISARHPDLGHGKSLS